MAIVRTDIQARVRADLDIEEEGFWSDADLNRFINTCIRELNSELLTLYEDYFLCVQTTSLVSAQKDYSYPTDIYHDKIRKIIYINGNTKYEVMRIRDLLTIPEIEDSDDFMWIPIYDATTGRKIRLHPTPSASETNVLTIYYIREIPEMTSDIITLPYTQLQDYIIAKTKYYCEMKDQNVETAQIYEQESARYMRGIVESFSTMILDGNDELKVSSEFYEDSI